MQQPQNPAIPSATPAASSYVPRRNIIVRVPSHISIKREIVTYHATSRNVKQEPGIYMTRHKNPKDSDRDWRYVHVSGRRCNQGGHLDCNSQSENESENDASEALPDLPVVPDPTLQASIGNKSTTTTTAGEVETNPRSGNAHPNITLISPPPVVWQLSLPVENVVPGDVNHNLNGLLCTLNFDVVPTASNERSRVNPTANPQPSGANVIAISSEDSSPLYLEKW